MIFGKKKKTEINDNNVEVIKPEDIDSSDGVDSSDDVDSSDGVDAIATFNTFMSLYQQSVELDAKVETFRIKSKVELARIASQYKLSHDFLVMTFGEREKALSKHYEVLDKGLETGDKDLIIGAMQSISSIVTKSPLQDFEKFAKAYDDESQKLLDW